MFMLGRRWGLLGADIGAWDVSALRARAAAIVMVAAVSAGLARVNPTRHVPAGRCEPPRVRWRLRCFGFGIDYSTGLAH
jgi:hypothetical protein